MAIVETHGSDVLGVTYETGDFYPYTKWQTAKFLLVDVGLMFTPLAVLSSIRKASYIRGGIKAIQRADKARDASKVVAIEKYMVERPIRSTLFAGGTVHGFWYSPLSPIYPQIMIVETVGDDFIAFYLDREGRISSFIPTDRFVRDYLESSGEDSMLTSRTRTPGHPKSFFDFHGMSALNSIRGSTPELTWEVASVSRKRAPARRRSRSDSRKPPAPRRGDVKRSAPFCGVHRRRHWCRFTRKR